MGISGQLLPVAPAPEDASVSTCRNSMLHECLRPWNMRAGRMQRHLSALGGSIVQWVGTQALGQVCGFFLGVFF